MLLKNVSSAFWLGVILSTSSAFAADIAEGQTKSAMCIACHGANGISNAEIYPNLAGQKATYLEKQIIAFKDGTRIDPTMAAMTATLTPEDIANIAAFYSSL
ncbi:cytochrome c [Alginatibacterium sediminis]|uniref:Cytochrome c n=1 Tax=Alginatibacterium sediminis TaxID=2164068 RepID=A0A420EL60_9ALTE|nr:cytochrome c [Alginatibacterium sediminis]RKF21471.1 cytochrome c [Alginatibacterium sediminis]